MSFVEGNISVGIELAPGTLDRLKANLANLEKGINLKVNIDPTPINQGTQALNQLNNAAQNSANTISSRLGSAVKQTGALIGTMAAVGGAGLVAVTTKAIQAGKEFNILQQQVRASLTAILGTSAAAEGLLKSVNKLNDTSPFPRSAFLSATQQLVGFGVKAEKVVPILDAVQNAVAGIGGDTNDIAMFTRAFAQIQSQGKLTGDVLFSLGEKGIDAAAIIGKSMGKSGQQIKNDIAAGTLGADASIDALTKGLKEKFAGAVDNVAKSYVGALDRVHARLRDIGAEITKAFINPMGGGAAVDALNNVAVALGNIRDNFIKPLFPLFAQMGNILVDMSQKFVALTSNLKSDQVKEFLSVFQALAPIIAIVARDLVVGLAQGIPVLRNLTGALGGPIAGIALVIATVPQLREQFIHLVTVLTPLVTALLPAFESAIKGIQQIFVMAAPIIGLAVSAISGLVSVLTPVINLLNKLGIAGPILIMIAARFAMIKLAGNQTFQALQTGISGFTSRLQGMRVGFAGMIEQATQAKGAALTMGEKFSVAGTVGKQAAAGIASGLSDILSPANLVIAGITIIAARLAQVKAKAQESADAITKGLDVNAPKDLNAALDETTKKLAAARDKMQGGAQVSIGGFKIAPFKDINKEVANVDALKKKMQELTEVGDKQRSLGAGVLQMIQDVPELTKQFKSVDDVLAFATANGVDFSNLRWDKINDSTADLVKKMKELPVPIDEAAKKMDAFKIQVDALDKIRAAADQLKSSEKALADLQMTSAQNLQDNVTKAEHNLIDVRRGAVAAADAVTSAEHNLEKVRRDAGAAADAVIRSELGLEEARRNVTQTQDKLNLLEIDRARLLADTGREAREVADAEATLARTGAELVDQEERRIELLTDLKKLNDTTPDKLAAGDRAIERAKIALNTATREQLNLEDELHKTQIANVDLSGLTPAQIRAKLAQVKAQLESQKNAKGTLKTQQEIADEVETASLNKADAEQSLKDAITSRGELELSINTQKREDEEALNALAIDHEATLRRQVEQQQQMSILLSGDTETARTLKNLNEQITSTNATLQTAVIGVRDAEREVQDAKQHQADYAITIRDAEEQVKDAMQHQADYAITIRDAQRDVATNIAAIKTHNDDIKNAQQQIKEDSIKYRDAIATAKSDTEATNNLLFERLGLNAKLLAQNPTLLKSEVDQLLNNITEGTPGVETHIQKQDRLRGPLMDIMLNHPDQLLAFLRQNGFGFAEGGIVNSETFARIGEAGREVVLPLTRPARMVDLLADSQVLHPVLAALGRIQLPGKSNVITPSAPSLRNIGSGGNVVVRRDDGPMTFGQARQIIALLEANGSGDIRVEAPITVNSQIDEEMLQRKIVAQLERKVYEILKKRR